MKNMPKEPKDQCHGCKKEFGWMHLYCNEVTSKWFCKDCHEKFDKDLQEFVNNYRNNEIS